MKELELDKLLGAFCNNRVKNKREGWGWKGGMKGVKIDVSHVAKFSLKVLLSLCPHKFLFSLAL